MKKLTIAAILLATLGFAQAQTNVSVYGNLDASAQRITNANGKTDTTSFADGSVTSSIWGVKGTEDLGSGLNASFNVEGDIQTNNGGLNQNGIFRRQSNVGIGSSAGQILLGVKTNPMIAAHSALMPVYSNSFAISSTLGLGYADFFTKNAITYISPTVAGVNAQLQYGASNTVGEAPNGSMYAGNAVYKGNGLTLTAAGQKRRGLGSTSSSNTGGDKTTWLVGGQYDIGRGLNVGLGYVNNNNAGVKVNNTQVGVGYQANSALVLGVNYLKADNGDKLTNVLARYNLSKRTAVYTQYNVVQNASSLAISPVYVTTSTSPVVDIAGYAAAPNTRQTAIGAGIIHSF